jgi:protein-tyrosine-phosphatase/predicted ATP-grasp superfamily ATP-dependent carboligase
MVPATTAAQRKAVHTPATNRVLVMGNDCGSFLGVVRSLGRRGVEVHGAHWNIDVPAYSSRYLAARHRLAVPGATDDWADDLSRLIERHSFDVVLPTNEQTVRLLQRSAWRADWEGVVHRIGAAAFETTFDKIESARLAESLSINVPRWRAVGSWEEAAAFAEEVGYPMILKPASSYAEDNLFDRRNVTTIASAEEMRRYAADYVFGVEPRLAQEYFRGEGVGLELLAEDGRVLTAFQHRRLHQPRGGGGSSYRESERPQAELAEAAVRIVAALNYTGVMMVEFLRNPADADWRFVEINARFWGSLPLALAAGADFPWYLYRLLAAGDNEVPQSFAVGKRCRNTFGEFKWLSTHLRGASRGAAIKELLLLPVRAFEPNDTFVLDDPVPAAAEYRKYWRRALVAVGEAAARPFRRLRQGRRGREHREMRRRLNSARHVLFVCAGNICRSPFAAQYAAQHWGNGAAIASSGTLAMPGRRSPPEAVVAAAKLGVALQEHRSSTITPEDVAAADLILACDEHVRRELVRRFPARADAVGLFGALSETAPAEVADPFGGSLSTFSEVYRSMAAVIDEAAADAPPATVPVGRSAVDS